MKELLIKSIAVIAILLMGNSISHAAVIKGKVLDEQKEGVPGATVRIDGTTIATTTDLNGTFQIAGIKDGKYTLICDYVFYQSQNVNLVLKGTSEIEFDIKPESQTLGEVVVKGVLKKNSEMGLLSAMKNSLVVQTGVSAQQITRTQDKDAAEVIRRVPGISIIDGKFVMVRGLSQRYNNVWINGSSVPSSESDSRAFSFDIIPSSQLDNLMIVKSPAAQYPADFSGGFILVSTKDVPQNNTFGISIGGNVNDQTHFKDFYGPQKSATDFLGFDNGFRSFNGGIKGELNKLSNGGIDLVNNGFNNDWKVYKSKPISDISLSSDYSRRWTDEDGRTLALLAALNFSNSSQTFLNMENSLFGAYDFDKDKSVYLRHSKDNQYTTNSRLGGMINLTYVTANGAAKYEFKNILNQLGRNRYTERIGIDAQSNNEQSAEYYYMSRFSYNGQFTGRYFLTDSRQFDWSLGYAYANNRMPDRKRYLINDAFEPGILELTSSNDIEREFTNLDEHMGSANMNYRDKINLFGKDLEIRAGLYGEYKTRKYLTRSFIYCWDATENSLPEGFRRFDIPPQLMQGKYYGEQGLYMLEQSKWRNNYNGNNILAAGYLGVNMPVDTKFNIYIGARYEFNRMRLITNTKDTQESHKSHDYTTNGIFPSLNAVYKFDERNYLRFAYGKTINRPEFREVSPSVYYDFDLASNVQGNYDLKSAYIHNLDLRYEYYPTNGELISASVFYKRFINPIEWTYTVNGGTDLTYSYVNAKGADSYGLELEMKKNLDFIGLNNFGVNFNGALIKSKVRFEEGSKNKNRAMQGQSPYLVNAGIFYQNEELGLNVAVLYNIIGKRIVGVGRNLGSGDNVINIPDSYEMPRNSLDLSASKKFFKSLEIKLSLRNLISQKVQYKQFENTTKGKVEELTREFNYGRNYGISVGYRF